MEALLLAERALLYTLAFDMHVEHAYSFLVKALDKLGVDAKMPPHKDFFQHSVSMLNDRCMGGVGGSTVSRCAGDEEGLMLDLLHTRPFLQHCLFF